MDQRFSRVWRGFGLPLTLVGCFALHAAVTLPRLTNNAFGDWEFTGWTGPIAERVLHGEAPYEQFTLPIPPGSFLVLALIQKLAGRAVLLQELWLGALCQLAMALLAYVIARRFASKLTSSMVALASLVMLLRSPKECAYDQTAELVAWGSLTVGALALTHASPRSRRWLWASAGALASLTLGFKQSTGAGVVSGWLVALLYLIVVESVSRLTQARRERLRDLVAWSAGAVAGVALLCLALGAVGSSPAAFHQAVFRDGASLKGGSIVLGANLVGYLLGSSPYPPSPILMLLASVVLVRLAKRKGSLDLQAPSSEAAPDRVALATAAATIAAFGGVALLVSSGTRGLPDQILYWTDRLRYVPGFGLLFGAVFAVAQLRKVPEAGPADAVRRGHLLNALALVALGTSLLHNLSAPEFRPFYDNNPIIAVAFLFLFLALDQARLPKLKALVFVLALGALYSPKLDRTLRAHIVVGRHGHWAGMKVSESGHEIIKAALRVRELTAEQDTVLVLPEDVQLAALIGRPRPAIRGAVVFVDQYPERLVDGDLATLELKPPKVVVIHPSEREQWQQFFATWTSRGGARRVTERFLDDLLPRRYLLDSSFDTPFGMSRGTLQVWVLRE